MIRTRLKTLALLFAALVLAHAQCLSACTIASCQDHGTAKKSCHQTNGKEQDTKACAHDALASPSKSGAADLEPATAAAPPGNEASVAPRLQVIAATRVLRAPPGALSVSPIVLRI